MIAADKPLCPESFEEWKQSHFFAKGGTTAEPLLSMADLLDAWNAALRTRPEGEAKVLWRVEQFVGNEGNGEWQNVVAHYHRERVEEYMQGSRFAMRLVKIETYETVVETRKKEA